jgi:hypothetical protein
MWASSGERCSSERIARIVGIGRVAKVARTGHQVLDTFDKLNKKRGEDWSQKHDIRGNEEICMNANNKQR